MNISDNTLQPPLNDTGPQEQSPKHVTTRPLEGTQGISPETSALADRMMEGMKRMNTDEAFRKEVESKVF